MEGEGLTKDSGVGEGRMGISPIQFFKVLSCKDEGEEGSRVINEHAN